MRTVRDIAEMALDYTDTSSTGTDILTPATSRQKKHLCSIITGALQELYRLKPDAFQRPMAQTLPAPTSGIAVFTAGSTTVNLSGFAGQDIRGRIFRYGSTWNQVLGGDTAPGSELLKPWNGTTGSHEITVYGDAFLIGSEGFNLIGNMRLDGYGMLAPCADRRTYLAYRDDLMVDDYSRAGTRINSRSMPAQPESWWVESVWRTGKATQLYCRFAPIPDREFTVTYDLAMKPRELKEADLVDDSLVLAVPDDFYDSILVPYVLQRWTGSPWFRNTEAKAEIARQYKVAQNTVADWSAQSETGTEAFVGCW